MRGVKLFKVFEAKTKHRQMGSKFKLLKSAQSPTADDQQ